MKKIVFFSLLIAISIWVLIYVNSEKEKQSKEDSKIMVVESQAASSLSDVNSSQSSSSSSVDFRLKVLSEPPGAEVYVESEKVGQAPVEFPVPVDSKKLKLSLTGYDDYERQIPAAKDSEGDLVWKIQLKKSPPKVVVNYYTKEVGPFSVQIKAVPLSDFYDSEESYSDLKAKFCRVKINDSMWVRVVTGPYKTKKMAAEALKKIKKKYADAFLSTKQKCLKDSEVL